MTPLSLDLFTPSVCPCGTGPLVDEDADTVRILTWCLCEDLLCFEAPTLGEALNQWEEYNGQL